MSNHILEYKIPVMIALRNGTVRKIKQIAPAHYSYEA